MVYLKLDNLARIMILPLDPREVEKVETAYEKLKKECDTCHVVDDYARKQYCACGICAKLQGY